MTSIKEIENLAFEIAFKDCSFFYTKECETEFIHFFHLVENSRILIARQDFAIKNHQVIFERFLKKHYKVNKNQLKGSAILIIGAGPSLNDCLDELKARQETTFIFSSLRSAIFLIQNGIIPDFIGVLDFVENLVVPEQLKKVPCFYTYQSNPKQMNSFAYPILIKNSDADPWEQMIVEQFLCSSVEVEAGHTVASFLFSVALSFSPKSITLYGVDLAYTERRKYFDSQSLVQENLQEIEGWGGKKYLTKQDFILSKYWFEYQIKKYPCVQFFNQSKGLILDGFRKDDVNQMEKKKSIQLVLKEMLNFMQIKVMRKKLEEVLIPLPIIGEISEILFFSDLQDLQLLEPLEKLLDPFLVCGYINAEKKTSFYLYMLNLLLNDLKIFIPI